MFGKVSKKRNHKQKLEMKTVLKSEKDETKRQFNDSFVVHESCFTWRKTIGSTFEGVIREEISLNESGRDSQLFMGTQHRQDKITTNKELTI